MTFSFSVLAQEGEKNVVYGREKIIADMEHTFYNEQVTSLPASPGTEAKADVTTLVSGICSITEKSSLMLSSLPIAIDENIMKAVGEIDPSKMMRMFVYAPTLVLDYNVYDFSAADSDPILILYRKKLGMDFRASHPPMPLSFGSSARDKANHALQLALFYLANRPEGQRISQEEIVEKVMNTMNRQSAGAKTKEPGKPGSATPSQPVPDKAKKKPAVVNPGGN